MQQFSAPKSGRHFLADQCNESESVAVIRASLSRSQEDMDATTVLATTWVETIREERGKGQVMDAFFAQYHLGSQEGLALMCLAEALLRVPDKAKQHALIADKFVQAISGDDMSYGSSWLVNMTSFGLKLGGYITHPDHQRHHWQRLVKRLGLPVMREATNKAMRLLGEQFILGADVSAAIGRMSPHCRYSLDCLGEAALTHADAAAYFDDYQQAIHRLKGQSGGLHERAGVSVKLSALYPRYEGRCHDEVVKVLTDRVCQLAQSAAEAGITLTIDAEEANRLTLSLAIIEAVFKSPSLADWSGLGLAVQAYQRRAPEVIDWAITLAETQQKALHVRLVKGAYWDSEIKHAQLLGLASYPVFTKKCHTDLCYLYCLQKLMAASDLVYPMVATHHPYTAAAAMVMAKGKDFEYQCLHGMGGALTDVLMGKGHSVRVYAPVGAHQTLLPYLVRRLLENGANSSFVHQVLDPNISVAQLVANPESLVGAEPSAHAQIPLPAHILALRENAPGLDIDEEDAMEEMAERMAKAYEGNKDGGPIVCGKRPRDLRAQEIQNPADLSAPLGQLYMGGADTIESALAAAHGAYLSWSKTPLETRAALLERAADLLLEKKDLFHAILVKEAGKTWGDAIAEVREAVDFCRYYAVQARRTLSPKVCPGPTGEHNTWQSVGRGVIICISPWNFPLAIFLGQVTAALVAGNTVVAKPATPTGLVATEAMALLHEAGIPSEVCHLVPSVRTDFSPFLSDLRVAGVMLTGSTATAHHIHQQLAKRQGPIIPLVAETGGQNAMLVDSTALPEQVVEDVITSAFRSAGQRCSALRVLFIQEEVFERILTMLKGAMETLVMGDPCDVRVDVGPVIDDGALKNLQAHQASLSEYGRLIHQCRIPDDVKGKGHFFAPCVYQIDALSRLEDEVFGPILHVISYKAEEWPSVVESIHKTGYGLTFGLHSRIQSHVDEVVDAVHVGNVYVNRNMVGATVGVQPFGGEGLSGTGPKGGGPWYLQRLCKEKVVSVDTTAAGGNASLWSLTDGDDVDEKGGFFV